MKKSKQYHRRSRTIEKTKHQKGPQKNSNATLGATVGNLMQSHKSRTEKIRSLRTTRSRLRKAFEKKISIAEQQFVSLAEETSREIEELKASLAEERHRANTLNSLTKTGVSRLTQLQGETSKMLEKIKVFEEDNKKEEDIKIKLNTEIQDIRKEKNSLVDVISKKKEVLAEMKKERREVEAECEKISFLKESQEEKKSALEARLEAFNEEERIRAESYSGKFAQTAKELESRFGKKRLEAEEKSLRKQYEEKLEKLVYKVIGFNNEQFTDYTNKVDQVRNSTNNLKERFSEIVVRKKEVEKELSLIDEEIKNFQKVIEEKQIYLKDEALLRKENKGVATETLERIREHVSYYYVLAERFRELTWEKISVLKNLNEAKEAIQEEERMEEGEVSNYSFSTVISPRKRKTSKGDNQFTDDIEPKVKRRERKGKNRNKEISMKMERRERDLLEETGSEYEEQESINIEDRILSTSLFPELLGDLEKKDLRVEAYIFARTITVTNTGIEEIFLEKGSFSIKLKRHKIEFKLPEAVSLKAGEFFLIKRAAFEDQGGAVVVFEWNEPILDSYALDELQLLRKNKMIHRTIVVSDTYYNQMKLLEKSQRRKGRQRNDEVLERREKKNLIEKDCDSDEERVNNINTGDKTCRIF